MLLLKYSGGKYQGVWISHKMLNMPSAGPFFYKIELKNAMSSGCMQWINPKYRFMSLSGMNKSGLLSWFQKEDLNVILTQRNEDFIMRLEISCVLWSKSASLSGNASKNM